MARWVLIILVFFGSAASSATISYQPTTSGAAIIEINGDIHAGDETTFKKVAAQFDSAYVDLSSNGGALSPALEIGTVVHSRGFGTGVVTGNQSTSSCALIWAAGTTRFLTKGGRVGFQASYVKDDDKVIENRIGNALVVRYLTQLGLSEKSIMFASASRPPAIAWIEKHEDREASGFAFIWSTLLDVQAKPK